MNKKNPRSDFHKTSLRAQFYSEELSQLGIIHHPVLGAKKGLRLYSKGPGSAHWPHRGSRTDTSPGHQCGLSQPGTSTGKPSTKVDTLSANPSATCYYFDSDEYWQRSIWGAWKPAHSLVGTSVHLKAERTEIPISRTKGALGWDSSGNALINCCSNSLWAQQPGSECGFVFTR